MKLSLRVKLTATFLIMTIGLFFMIGVMANVLLEKQFKNYIIEKQNQKNSDIVQLLSSRRSDWGGKWNLVGIENIGVNMLSEGLLLRIKENDGSVVWDAREHNNGMCTMMIEHMAQNMQSLNPNFNGAYTEQTFPLLSNGQKVGSVDIGYYGPYYYSDSDMKYLSALNQLLIWAGVICALLAMLLGLTMSRRLTKPIHNVIGTARKIAQGDYGDRVKETSSTTEIIELTLTINSLAETLGTQEVLRKRLTADVAHELRTPLATLQSHLEAMIDGIWKADTERLKSCHEETIRLSKMVGDIERLTKYEGENLVLCAQRFDISSMLKRIVMNFEGPFRSKGVQLAFSPQVQLIEADEDKISQVFINLLSNALNYTNAGGSVLLDVSANSKTVEVSLTDTGMGMSAEDLPYIFERFYRTDKSRNRLTGGSGIGLAIAKAIVDAHHGSIRVQSELGKGSTFVVSLPL